MAHSHDEHGHHHGMVMATAAPAPMNHGAHSMHRMDDMDMGNDTQGMGMGMFFHTGFKEIILFEGWSTDTVGGMVGSCIGVFLMAMLYEALKYYREDLFKRSYASVSYSSVTLPGVEGRVTRETHQTFRNRMFSISHSVQSLLHIVQITLSYFLMLIFMTYNAWLCISLVLGAGTGFFIFGWRKSIVVDITEHCH